MAKLFDTHAPKKSVTVRINSDFLVKARELHINLSATLDKALKEELKQKQRELWRKQNAKAIQVYNRFVKKRGIFSDGLRSF